MSRPGNDKKRNMKRNYDDNSAERKNKSSKRHKSYATNEHHHHGGETDPKSELYVSNLDTRHAPLFASFLFHLMKELDLITRRKNKTKPNDNFRLQDFISGIRVGKKRDSGFISFIEFRDATSALRLNNIPFMGKRISLKRPHAWEGPDALREAREDWGYKLVKFHSQKKYTTNKESENEGKKSKTNRRSLVIKNIPLDWSKEVRGYILSALEQLGIVKDDEDPIETLRLYGSIGYATFRSERDARKVYYSLQNLPFLDRRIKFEIENESSTFFDVGEKKLWSTSINNFFYNKTPIINDDKESERKINSSNNSNSKQQKILPLEEPEKSHCLSNNDIDGGAIIRDTEKKNDDQTNFEKNKSSEKEEESMMNLAESLSINKTLEVNLKIKSSRIYELETTMKSKDFEISNLHSKIKQMENENLSLKKELVETKILLSNKVHNDTKKEEKVYSNNTIAANAATTVTVLDNNSNNNQQEHLNLFLQKELEIKRNELEEKSNRIKNLEGTIERHMEKIMNLTTALLSEGTKQRELASELENERSRRRTLEIQNNDNNSNNNISSSPQRRQQQQQQNHSGEIYHQRHHQADNRSVRYEASIISPLIIKEEERNF